MWLSKDPIGISGGLNLYVFCGNNPVNYVDPSGLCEEDSEGGGFLPWLQGILDVGGTFEPTPFCDIINSLIYCGRGEWGDAGFSVLAMIPALGQVSTAGKYANKARKLKNLNDALDNLDTIQDTKKMIRKGKISDKIIDSTQKSEDDVKNMLRDLTKH